MLQLVAVALLLCCLLATSVEAKPKAKTAKAKTKNQPWQDEKCVAPFKVSKAQVDAGYTVLISSPPCDGHLKPMSLTVMATASGANPQKNLRVSSSLFGEMMADGTCLSSAATQSSAPGEDKRFVVAVRCTDPKVNCYFNIGFDFMCLDDSGIMTPLTSFGMATVTNDKVEAEMKRLVDKDVKTSLVEQYARSTIRKLKAKVVELDE
jgi:hypothetical protein